ncbi:RHS repeat-associated core domain-containing protein [Dokdonella koreensis]|uniref:RHS repeat-associated core domain-containing protein n=1 Tax=Dokdonella koreensis TaxID=323415 RepID=UPI00167FFE4D|nr:RHS repeat-associated core domain-containing protein [Dokdonella koreensis]
MTTYIHTDAFGSVTRKTNSTGGIVEDRIYEPYGESLEVTTRAPQWPQGMTYTGHVLDNLTRIAYAQARYYDQLMGRFMSPDPVAPDAGNFNRYWYANNNPFSMLDPDGRKACGKDTTCALERGDWGRSSARFYGSHNVSPSLGNKGLIGGVTIEKRMSVAASYDFDSAMAIEPPSPPEGLVNASAGLGDSLTLGLTDYIRELLGSNDVVDKTSDAYGNGVWAGVAVGAAGGIGVFKNAVVLGRTVTVTRWGGPGVWYIVGGRSTSSWWLSGSRTMYPYGSAVTIDVAAGRLSYPSGWQWWKGLIGQRILNGAP